VDLFEAQVQVEVEKRLTDIVKNDPHLVIRAYEKENTYLKSKLLEASKEIEVSSVKAGKWEKFLDADGYMDVSEIAERIRIPYIDPSGKRRTMGLIYFCKVLRYDKILLLKSNGYGLHSQCPKKIFANSKIVLAEKNDMIRSSVKMNALALNYLDDKYSSDDRIWHSETDKEIYFE